MREDFVRFAGLFLLLSRSHDGRHNSLGEGCCCGWQRAACVPDAACLARALCIQQTLVHRRSLALLQWLQNKVQVVDTWLSQWKSLLDFVEKLDRIRHWIRYGDAALWRNVFCVVVVSCITLAL